MSEPGSSVADSAASMEDDVVAEAIVAAVTCSVLQLSCIKTPARMGQAAIRSRVSRSVFPERVKSLQAFHAASPITSAAQLTPTREKTSDRPSAAAAAQGGSQRAKRPRLVDSVDVYRQSKGRV